MTETKVLVLPDEEQFKHDIQAINRFQQVVHSTMVEGLDYGVIPGTQKPSLLKPGAEKITKLLGLSDQYEIVDRQEDWQKPFFRYLVKCKLIHLESGMIISEGLGECNSMESKYRWRWLWPSEVPEDMDKNKMVKRMVGKRGAEKKTPQYRIENDDIFSQVNTILKMGKKRALVDAALSAGRLSDVFTQDVEDMADTVRAETAARAKAEETVIEGEFKDVTKELSPDNPYAFMLDKCPEHDSEWHKNKFEKLCHKTPDNKWCNFSDIIKPYIEQASNTAGIADSVELNAWLKERFGGRTWSKLSEAEQVEFLYMLAKEAGNEATAKTEDTKAEADKKADANDRQGTVEGSGEGNREDGEEPELPF